MRHIGLLLGVATLAVYWPVTGFQFINYDDPVMFTENPHVLAGLTAGGFKWAFISEATGIWNPVTMLSLMLDCQLFGVKPWWPHLVNALLHAANAMLLYGLLKRMTGAPWRSVIVAGLFALHPLHVESVAWVTERKDVLSTFFWLLTIWAYLRYAKDSKSQTSKYGFYGLSLLFCALGMMSKPMMVTLPCTLLLLDYWPLGRLKEGWRLVREKIPYFAMSAGLALATIAAEKHAQGMLTMENFPPGERAGHALSSYASYVEKMFWPRNLTGFYLLTRDESRWFGMVVGGVLVSAVTGLVVWQWRRRPYLATGWFWYMGTLLPVIGLTQAGMQAMADRFTYVPLIGLFVIVAWGGWELASVLHLRGIAAAASACAMVTCAGLTVHQEFFWKDTEAYNRRILEVMPKNYIAHSNLGSYYLGRGRVQDALTHFQAAVQENPDYADGRYNLGSLYLGMGRTEEAIYNLKAAIRLDTHFAQARNNLGSIYLAQKRYDEAIEQFRESARLLPGFHSYMNLGNALGEHAGLTQDIKELGEAAEAYGRALQLEPQAGDARENLAKAWIQLGLAYAGHNRRQEAESVFRQLVQLVPGEPVAHFNLAQALMSQGKREEAAQQYREALRINPGFAAAQMGLKAAEGKSN
jgi:Tfp pilus assembly protein PilF